MRIVKPLRLSLLTRPYTFQRQHRMGVTVLAMATMGPQPKLLPEAEIWTLTSQWLEEDNVVDLAVPKPCAEFLVSGRAWSHAPTEPGRAALRVAMGGHEKTLLAFGDRRAESNRWSEPEPLRGLRVDWEHSYGGSEFAENPCGRGMHRDDKGLWCAPNIEALGHRRLSPGQVGQAAGFGPVSPIRPRRFERSGKFDAAWIKNGFPGFLDSLDPHFFNAAEPDQWLPEWEEFPPGTPYEIWNMHEHHQCVRGELPDWRARCFIVRSADEALEEISLRHTTAWFFPDVERVLLMFQGAASATVSDASDIAAVMPAIENVDAARDIEHYLKVFRQRQARGTGPVHALKDSDLLPRAAIRDEDFFNTDALSQPLMLNQQKRADSIREQMDARIQSAGRDPDAYRSQTALPTDVRSLEDLPELVRTMRREGRLAKVAALRRQREAEQAAQQHARKGEGASEQAAQQHARKGEGASEQVASSTGSGILQGNSAPGGPPRFNKSSAALSMIAMANEAQHTRAGSGTKTDAATGVGGGTVPGADTGTVNGADPAAVRAMLDKGQQGMEDLYLRGAHLQSAVAPALGGRSVRMRRRVEQLMQGSRDLSGLDLTGIDLSGLDLSGARCRRTWMESANLTNTVLVDADLSEAVLTRATLSNSVFDGANFHAANLGGLLAESSSFERALFNETVLDEAAFARCAFHEAAFNQCSPRGVELVGCSFERARFEAVNFWQQSRFSEVTFHRAVLTRVVWLDCELDDVDFGRAQLTASGWVQSTCIRPVSFRHAHLLTCCAVQTDFSGAQFSHAWLQESSLRGIDLENAVFNGARLQSSDLSECNLREASFYRVDGGGSLLMHSDLTGANMRESDWIDALLAGSDLRFADLADANLFRADVSQSRMDAGTRMTNTYVKWAKTVPAFVEGEG